MGFSKLAQSLEEESTLTRAEYSGIKGVLLELSCRADKMIMFSRGP